MQAAGKQDFSGLGPKLPPGMRHESDKITPTPPSTRQAVFPLMEGDVTLSFPAGMSSASAKALASYVSLFLEQTRLQAEERERWREEHGREADE